MPYGFLSSSRDQFPNEKPPTWFHPASPKSEPIKTSEDDFDSSSITTTSTFSSKIDLLKESVKSKTPASYSAYRARKKAAAQSVVTSLEEKPKIKKSLPAGTQTRKPILRSLTRPVWWTSAK